MADLSDSIDDSNFQAFLREPLSSESSLAAVEEIKPVPKIESRSRPKSPAKLWWMTGNSNKASLVECKKQTQNIPAPESLNWLKAKSVTSEVPQNSTLQKETCTEVAKDRSADAAVNVLVQSKEASPGVVTTSGTTDSMAEFLAKETEFKEESEQEKTKRKEEDGSSDTLVDDDYVEDFTEDISDELYGASQDDVKAIMQMLAKQLESVDLQELDIPDLNLPDTTAASGGSSRERSVEEILEEVEELERSTSRSSSLEKDKAEVTQVPIETQSTPENTTPPVAMPTSTPKQANTTKHTDKTIPVTVPTSTPKQGSTTKYVSKTTLVSASTSTPQQSNTPKPVDTSTPPQSSRPRPVTKLLEPDLSVNVPSSSDTPTKQVQFTSASNPIGPSGDVATTKSSHTDLQKTTEDTKTHENSDVEDLLLTQRAKYLKLQATLERRELDHEKQLESLKVEHEKEVFELKKHSYYLNAKVQDYEQAQQTELNTSHSDSSELKVQLLETEVLKQEQLIVATQKENEKLCNQVKELKVCQTFFFVQQTYDFVKSKHEQYF